MFPQLLFTPMTFNKALTFWDIKVSRKGGGDSISHGRIQELVYLGEFLMFNQFEVNYGWQQCRCWVSFWINRWIFEDFLKSIHLSTKVRAIHFVDPLGLHSQWFTDGASWMLNLQLLLLPGNICTKTVKTSLSWSSDQYFKESNISWQEKIFLSKKEIFLSKKKSWMLDLQLQLLLLSVNICTKTVNKPSLMIACQDDEAELSTMEMMEISILWLTLVLGSIISTHSAAAWFILLPINSSSLSFSSFSPPSSPSPPPLPCPPLTCFTSLPHAVFRPSGPRASLTLTSLRHLGDALKMWGGFSYLSTGNEAEERIQWVNDVGESC